MVNLIRHHDLHLLHCVTTALQISFRGAALLIPAQVWWGQADLDCAWNLMSNIHKHLYGKYKCQYKLVLPAQVGQPAVKRQAWKECSILLHKQDCLWEQYGKCPYYFNKYYVNFCCFDCYEAMCHILTRWSMSAGLFSSLYSSRKESRMLLLAYHLPEVTGQHWQFSQ